MFIPKVSHLVERVAERLLRSDALDESAAQLLRRHGAAVPDVVAASTQSIFLQKPLLNLPTQSNILP